MNGFFGELGNIVAPSREGEYCSPVALNNQPIFAESRPTILPYSTNDLSVGFHCELGDGMTSTEFPPCSGKIAHEKLQVVRIMKRLRRVRGQKLYVDVSYLTQLHVHKPFVFEVRSDRSRHHDQRYRLRGDLVAEVCPLVETGRMFVLLKRHERIQRDQKGVSIHSVLRIDPEE